MHTLAEIKLCILVGDLLVFHITRSRVDPLLLRAVVKVDDAATTLEKTVVEREPALKMQALGDKVEVLAKHKVSIDFGSGAFLDARCGYGESRVLHIGVTGCVIAPGAVAVHRTHSRRSRLIGRAPETRA